MNENKQAQPDHWRPVRTHAILRRFRRGPGRTTRFVGQQQDEQVRRIVREHPIFIAPAVVPFLLALVFLALLTWSETTQALSESLMLGLDLICGLAVIGSALYGLYRIFALWWVNVYIITDKRVLAWRGFLTATSDETTLDKVQQVGVDQKPLGILLDYGTVHVYLAGGKPLLLERVPNPRRVRDDIEGIRQSYHAAKPPKPPLPLTEPATASKLETLAKQDPLPQLPDADAKWEHRRSPTQARGPLRRFGGPLRLKCDVHYDAEEYTVMYVQRSWEVLVINLIIPVLLLVGALVGAIAEKGHFLNLFAIAFVVILVLMGLAIINYIDDVFILTNKRIIDIDRKFAILAVQTKIASYDRISQIVVSSPNPIQLALDVGDLHIETQGSNPDIHMLTMSHARYIQNKIYEIKNFKEKVEKIKTKNEFKGELNEWFSNVLTTMRGVPNLQSLDFLTALERANELGMEVVVVDESANQPGVGAGKIVKQSPPPGTVVYVNPANAEEKPQIQVTLSE